MKNTVLIFFGSNGAAAKAEAGKRRNGLTNAYIRDAASFDGEDEEGATMVMLMPCVGNAEAKRIAAAYGDKVSTINGAAVEVEVPVVTPTDCHAQHRGKGRWYVMRGDEIISGPYAKEDVEAAVEREKAIAA